MIISHLYPKFWAVFRTADIARGDLFSSSRIGSVNYIARSASLTGAHFVASVSRSGGMVQCEVMFNTRKADRKSLLQLASLIDRDKDKILSSLGPSYSVEKAEHALVVRRVVNDVGNILDESSWEKLAEALVFEVTKLFNVMNPYIQNALSEIYHETIFKIERRTCTEQIMLPT